jgi:TRAP-type C4-dicarboxylate transport system permease small subunit
LVLDKADAMFVKAEIGLTHISWMVCLAVTFMIVTDIIMRFFLNQPLPASWEISEISMPYIVFFPFAYALTVDAHVRVSLVRDRMPKKIQLTFDLLANFIFFVFCSMLTYWSWLRFWDSFIVKEEILAAIQLPWWVGKIAMPIGMGMFALRYLIKFLRTLTDPR